MSEDKTEYGYIFLDDDAMIWGFDSVEEALNSKYCKLDYDPYEDGLYVKIPEE